MINVRPYSISSASPFKRAGGAESTDSVPPVFKVIDDVTKPQPNTGQGRADSQSDFIETIETARGIFAPVSDQLEAGSNVYAPTADSILPQDKGVILIAGEYVEVEGKTADIKGIDVQEQGRTVSASCGCHI